MVRKLGKYCYHFLAFVGALTLIGLLTGFTYSQLVLKEQYLEPARTAEKPVNLYRFTLPLDFYSIALPPAQPFAATPLRVRAIHLPNTVEKITGTEPLAAAEAVALFQEAKEWFQDTLNSCKIGDEKLSTLEQEHFVCTRSLANYERALAPKEKAYNYVVSISNGKEAALFHLVITAKEKAKASQRAQEILSTLLWPIDK